MKEPNTLPDVQLDSDSRGIELSSVGVRKVVIPLRYRSNSGEVYLVPTECSLAVSLSKELKGTHMSRFMTLLTEHSKQEIQDFNPQTFLGEIRRSLHTDSSSLSFKLGFAVTKPAPITGLESQMVYDVNLLGLQQESGEASTVFDVLIPTANLCPCSKAISDYGAHNQRLFLRVAVSVDPSKNYPAYWLENLILAVEEAGSCPVYPILKRADEKYVTERQYDNPKFVEDVVRDAALIIRQYPSVIGFRITAEAQESIHAHNAWAQYSENFPIIQSKLALDF